MADRTAERSGLEHVNSQARATYAYLVEIGPVVRMTQEALAEQLGCTRRTMVRHLRELQRAGLVKTGYRVLEVTR